MRRLSSILSVALAVLAFGWARPVSAQMTVTGTVANSSGIVRSNTPVFITPRSTLQFVDPWLVTSERITARTDGAGAFRVRLLVGNYVAAVGNITNDWLTFTVESNSGTNDIHLLATSTNLVYSPTNWMEGATALADGLSGLVPQPLAGDQGKFLRGDGTWQTVSGGSGDGSYERVEAGSNIAVTQGSVGGTNVFTVAAGSGLATDAEVASAVSGLASQSYADAAAASAAQAATNNLGSAAFTLTTDYQPYSAALAALAIGNGGALTNLGNGTTVSAGANITVNQTTNPNGSKNYEVTGSAGGGSGSYERVEAGTDITVTPSSVGGTNVFTVAAGSGLATDSEVSSSISALSAVYQAKDTDLDEWSAAGTNRLSVYLPSATAATTYQAKDAELDEWAAAGTNRLSTYLTTSTAATTYQAKDTDLDEWASAGTNRLSVYLTTATAATTYQAKDTDLDEWAAAGTNRLSTYLTTASAASTYATIASQTANTNHNHLRVTNNVASQVQVISAASNGTNYLLNAAIRAQHIDVTGNVRIVGLVGGLAGYELPFSICLSNGTGSAYTLELTNIFKPLRGHTNTIPANGVTWLGGVVRGDRVSYGAVPEQ